MRVHTMVQWYGMMQPHDIRQYLIELTPYLKAAAAFFTAGLLLGTYIARALPESAGVVQDSAIAFVEGFAEMTPAQLFLFIFLNNAVKTFVFMLLGIVFGIVPALFLFLNGAVIGVVVALLFTELGGVLIAAALIPHGIIEIPAVLAGSAIGLLLGTRVFQKLRDRDIVLLPHFKRSIQFFTIVLIPLFLLAAAIEVVITPSVVRFVAGA